MMMYAISVISGKEFDIVQTLKGIDGIKAYLPTNLIEIRKGGAWHIKEKILMPGYIFISCKFNNDIYYKVKNVPGVNFWIGKGSPESMLEQDEEFILFLHNEGKPIPILNWKSPYLKRAVIRAIDKRQRRITATINVCDKIHTITFGYSQ